MPSLNRGVGLTAVVVTLGCTRASPSLLVEVTSSLAIPAETDSLVARVLTIDGAKLLEEQSYALGSAPNDVWPQTLPIISGETSPTDFALVVELRKTRGGAPSDVMGFASAQARFPDFGTREVPLPVPRVCTDEDYDEYGLGLGCRGPDCDDSRPEVPVDLSCDSDAGVGDASRDGGSRDGGRDAGFPDGGPIPCDRTDAGSCGPGFVCTPLGRCARECVVDRDCGRPWLMCLQTIEACFCRVPCRPAGGCGPYACVDGCCQVN
ncbi:MAG: hypothetical protein HYV07_22840 [Deltaproteobacteria bacterium]|nr:hypothetical protein [Deltaproteobacteria bacterium]